MRKFNTKVQRTRISSRIIKGGSHCLFFFFFIRLHKFSDIRLAKSRRSATEQNSPVYFNRRLPTVYTRGTGGIVD